MKFPAMSSKRYNSQFAIPMSSTKIEIMGNTAEPEGQAHLQNKWDN